MRLRRFTLMVLAVALVLCVGCGTYAHEHRNTLGTEIAIAGPSGAPRSRVSPICARLAIGGVALPTSTAIAALDDDRLPLDPATLRTELRDLLRGCATFERVDLAEDDPEHRDVLFVETRLERATLERCGNEEPAVLPLAIWCVGGFLSDWQHDRTYELMLAPTFVVRERATGAKLAEVRPRPGKAHDTLSLFERRSGAGAFVATLFACPPMVFDSTPTEVQRALASRAWNAPAQDLVRAIAGLQLRYRVQEPVQHPDPRVSAKLLAPEPGVLLATPTADVRVRLTVRPGKASAVERIWVGNREIKGAGPQFDAPFEGVRLEPGRPVEVRAQFDSGPPVVVLELQVQECLAPSTTGGRK